MNSGRFDFRNATDVDKRSPGDVSTSSEQTVGKAMKVRCCIVGGGPAGMMLGYLLGRAGIDVVVLENSTRRGNTMSNGHFTRIWHYTAPTPPHQRYTLWRYVVQRYILAVRRLRRRPQTSVPRGQRCCRHSS
jgi:glycine/D-amino acid oxidase-like deaminating enzyme